MNQKLKLMFGTLGVLGLSITALGQASHIELPDGKGKAELIHSCTPCHRTDLIVRVKKTPEDWRKTVDDMVARGTDGTKEDFDNIVLYLSTNFALEKSGSTATATQSAAPAASLNPSEIESAKNTITGNGCLACHRIEKEGSYMGPTLNGLGSRRAADQIRNAIVNPSPKLSPANDLARFTTSDGKTVSGRILSQDDQKIRVISASGEATTYPKSGLSQFTVIDTNPMPPFKDRITGADLEGLVRYLATLPAVNEDGQK